RLRWHKSGDRAGHRRWPRARGVREAAAEAEAEAEEARRRRAPLRDRRPRKPIRRVAGAPSRRRVVRHAAAAEPAVPAGIFREILLVIILGVVERLLAADLRRDPAEPARRQRALVAVAAAHGLRASRVAADVDRGPILRADIVALAHALRRVVRFPEQLKQLRERQLARIVDDGHDLGVAREAGAYLAVRRRRRIAAGLAGRRRY